MNLYLLVEGRRTEMAVYPAWLSYLLPYMTRINRPFEVRKNNYYIVSGFGYPNLLGHIANCVKDVNRYSLFDYLVICFDSDTSTVADRVREIENNLNRSGVWPKHANIKVIVQKKCIETWFLGSRISEPVKKNPKVSQLIDYYNVYRKNPENMEKPSGYHGSVGDFHYDYLARLLESRGKIYTKRNPSAVCTDEYIESLIRRVDSTRHLKTLRNFFYFCRGIKDADHLREETDKEGKATPPPPAGLLLADAPDEASDGLNGMAKADFKIAD